MLRPFFNSFFKLSLRLIRLVIKNDRRKDYAVGKAFIFRKGQINVIERTIVGDL